MSAAVLSESSLSYHDSHDAPLKKSVDECSEPNSTDDASTAAPETPMVSRSASIVESTASVPPTIDNTIILHNVSHSGPSADPKLAGLIKQTRELSELVFDEDCLTEITKKTRWKLTLLATSDYATLCGFAVSRITNGALSLAKIAVPVEFRGLGFGKLIMEDAIKNAKKQNDVYEVCLSSLSTAVTFYQQRLGFKAMTGVKVKTDFEVVEGQVFMVKKLRPRPKGK